MLEICDKTCLIRKTLVRKAVDKGRILFIKNKLWCVIVFENKLWCVIVFDISSANVGDQKVTLYIFFLDEIFTFLW